MTSPGCIMSFESIGNVLNEVLIAYICENSCNQNDVLHVLASKSTFISQFMFNKDELNKLYQYALSLTRQEDTAYDLVQSALEKSLRKIPQPIDKPQAYLKVIIRNLFFDIERHKKVVLMVSTDSGDYTY